MNSFNNWGLEQVFLISLVFFSLFFGIWEICQNKHIQKYFDYAPFINRVGVSILIILHYSLYFLIYSTIFFRFLYPDSFDRRYLIAYLIFISLVLLSWFIYDNQCLLTVWTNNIINVEEKFGFRDPFDLILDRYPTIGEPGALNLRDKIYYLYLIIAIIISIYLLYKDFS